MNLRAAQNTDDAVLIARIAERCWRHHYTPIIGGDQVDYMLGRFQSAAAIADQIADGRCYFLIEALDATPLGYLAIDLHPDHLFLSKLYVLPAHQRCGIGEWTVAELSRRHPQHAIHLTVNKHNHAAIGFYQKAGFENRGPLVSDIGSGYVMDDWKMVRKPTTGA